MYDNSITPEIQSFVAGLVFGINVSILVSAFCHAMDWCRDPLAVKLKEQVKELEADGDEKNAKLDELTDEIEKLRENIEELEEEREDYYEEIEGLYDEVEDKRKRISSLIEKVRDLREVIRIRSEVDGSDDTSSLASHPKRRRIEK